MKLPNLKKPCKECPYCSGDNGFYEKLIESRRLYYLWDGSANGGSEPMIIKGGKHLYCVDCDKAVTGITAINVS